MSALPAGTDARLPGCQAARAATVLVCGCSWAWSGDAAGRMHRRDCHRHANVTETRCGSCGHSGQPFSLSSLERAAERHRPPWTAAAAAIMHAPRRPRPPRQRPWPPAHGRRAGARPPPAAPPPGSSRQSPARTGQRGRRAATA